MAGRAYAGYPVAIAHRRGKKVAWNYYKTIDEAIACSDIARIRAAKLKALGWDFDFEFPGNIHKYSEISEANAGLYEVCIC